MGLWDGWFEVGTPEYDAEVERQFKEWLPRAMEQAKMTYERAKKEGWPGFSESDQKMIREVTEAKITKKQRVAQRIWALRSSVSELTLSTVDFVEDPEAQERKMIIDKYLRMFEMIPWKHKEYELQFQKFSSWYDLWELKTELRTLEVMFVEEWWDLDELYSWISEVGRFERNVDTYAEGFWDALGLNRVQRMDDVINRMWDIYPHKWWSFMWSALEAQRENPIRSILESHGIDDPTQYLLDSDAEIDTTPRIDWYPLRSIQDYDSEPMRKRSKLRNPFIKERFSRKS